MLIIRHLSRYVRMFPRTVGSLGALLLLGLLGTAMPAGAQQCSDCHEQPAAFASSAHAEVECSSCHLNHEAYPHPADAETMDCAVCHSAVADQTALGVHAQERLAGNEAAPDCVVCHGAAHEIARPGTTPFRRVAVETCAMCHSAEGEQFQQSVHGQAVAAGNREAPTCGGCHGEHGIQRPSDPAAPTNAGHIRETCAQCHGDVPLMSRFGLPTDRVLSFDASFHGLSVRAGSQRVANCGSCHGIHNILPSSDPASMVHSSNLPATCGSCHPGAGSRFSLGPIHVLEGEGQAPIADLIRAVYLVLIPLVLGLMLIHNAGDWLRKTRRRVHGAALASPAVMELRMFPAERVQHGLLIVSFLTLTWTGFALKFPDHFWAYPLVVWEFSWPVRGWIHRIAGAVFIATSVLHLATLVGNSRLRNHWKQLLPKTRDVREAVSGFLYNVGLRRKQPLISPHSYVEKAEYWAVVWGGVLMSVSGVMLWADDFFLTHAPKALLDVAAVVHYYEAILAALAILIWHFYAVIFDPAVYPMSGAWLTGYGPKRAVSAESPAAAGPASSEVLEATASDVTAPDVKKPDINEPGQPPAPGAPKAGPRGQRPSGGREKEI